MQPICNLAIGLILVSASFACDSPSSKSRGGASDASPLAAPEAPTEEEGDNNFLFKKYQAGIDFYAVGNEPDWSLDMDFENLFKFNTLAEFGELSTPAVEPILAQDANVKLYVAEVESGTLRVQVSESPCSSTMSEEQFSYTVTVEVKRGVDQEFTTFKGCGRYVPDFRLTDIWVLEELYGEAVQAEDFQKELPRLEIKMRDGRIMGHDGCNNMNASLEAGSGIWRMSHGISTLMACPNMELSDKVRSSLEASSYAIGNNRLTLKKGPLVTAIWRKVD